MSGLFRQCNLVNENLQGIVHLGAHKCEELGEYEQSGTSFIVWAEANPKMWPDIKKKFLQSKVENYLFEGAISNRSDDRVKFVIFNFPECSSLFNIGKEMNVWYPHHKEEYEIQVDTITVDTMLERFGLDIGKVDYLSLDLQGAELLAFEGAQTLLNSPSLRYVHTEAIMSDYYEGAADGNQICNVLSNYGFKEIARERHHPFYMEIQHKIDVGEIGTLDQFNIMFHR